MFFLISWHKNFEKNFNALMYRYRFSHSDIDIDHFLISFCNFLICILQCWWWLEVFLLCLIKKEQKAKQKMHSFKKLQHYLRAFEVKSSSGFFKFIWLIFKKISGTFSQMLWPMRQAWPTGSTLMMARWEFFWDESSVELSWA